MGCGRPISRTLRSINPPFHLTYNWWKYALVIILGALAVNLYFTVTVYRPPEDKKVDLYVYGPGDEAGLKQYVAGVHDAEKRIWEK